MLTSIMQETMVTNNWQEILHEAGVKFPWLLVEGENQVLPEMENARLCMEGLCKYI